ncbi:glycohydrolase toxin TNT-related protein [Cellulomonas soli]
MPGEALALDRIGSEQGTDLWPSGAPFATRSLPPDRLELPGTPTAWPTTTRSSPPVDCCWSPR